MKDFFDLKKFLQRNKITNRGLLLENTLLNLGYYISPKGTAIVSDLEEKEPYIEEQLTKAGYTYEKSHEYDTFSNKIVVFEVTNKNLHESGVVHARVIKEGPLNYKIVVNVPERPNINYAYTVEAGSEEEALAKLEEKLDGRSYSVKSIKGFEQLPPSPVDRNKVDWTSIEIGDIDTGDYPKFTDAYIEAANFVDGRPLSDWQLDSLSYDLRNTGELSQMAYETLFEGLTPREKILKEQVIKMITKK